MSVCLDVVLRYTVAAEKLDIMLLLCCITIVFVRNHGEVSTTFDLTVLHCTGIGIRRETFRNKPVAEKECLLMCAPFKPDYFFRSSGGNVMK